MSFALNIGPSTHMTASLLAKPLTGLGSQNFILCTVCFYVTDLPSHRIADCILFLFFKMMTTVRNQSYYCPVLLFNEPVASQRCITSGFIFTFKHFHHLWVQYLWLNAQLSHRRSPISHSVAKPHSAQWNELPDSKEVLLLTHCRHLSLAKIWSQPLFSSCILEWLCTCLLSSSTQGELNLSLSLLSA